MFDRPSTPAEKRWARGIVAEMRAEKAIERANQRAHERRSPYASRGAARSVPPIGSRVLVILGPKDELYPATVTGGVRTIPVEVHASSDQWRLAMRLVRVRLEGETGSRDVAVERVQPLGPRAEPTGSP